MTLQNDPSKRETSPNAPPKGVLQLEESRRSFHRQIEQLKDIDEKAMRSVRTAVVVIGFVVTAVGIATRNGHVSFGVGPTLFTGFGVFFLAVTVVIGVGTSSVTEYRTRLSDVEYARVEQPTGSSRGSNAELVRIYRSWLNTTEDELSESAAFLTATLTALMFGVLSLLTAAALAVTETLFSFETASPFRSGLLHIAVVICVFLGMGLATKLTIRSVNAYL